MGKVLRHWITFFGALRAEESFVRRLASLSLLAAFALTVGCSGAADPSIGTDPTEPAPAPTTPVTTSPADDAGAQMDNDAGSDASSTGVAKNYVAADAVSFAASHWDDGIGLCAEFVSDCLIAGHLDIKVLPWVPDLLGALSDMSLPFEEHGEDDPAEANLGDVVFFSDASGDKFCDNHSNDEGNCGHTCIVTTAGTSTSTIQVDCHNNAHHKMALTDFFGSEFSRYRIYHLVTSN